LSDNPIFLIFGGFWWFILSIPREECGEADLTSDWRHSRLLGFVGRPHHQIIEIRAIAHGFCMIYSELMYVPPLLENGTIFLYRLKVGWLPKICSFLGIHIGRTGWGATTLLSALCWPSKWTMTPHPWPTSLWKAGKSAADVLSISSDVQC